MIKFGWKGGDGAIFFLTPLFCVAVLMFICLSVRGYSIYCVNDADFRNAVITSLNANSIKFEEKMNKMELVDIDNELNIAFMAWFGAGMIKIKNKKDKIIFKKIIDEIKIYFKENNVISKKIVAIFYLIFGVFYIALGIGLVILFS
jgi:hypothetical protein